MPLLRVLYRTLNLLNAKIFQVIAYRYAGLAHYALDYIEQRFAGERFAKTFQSTIFQSSL